MYLTGAALAPARRRLRGLGCPDRRALGVLVDRTNYRITGPYTYSPPAVTPQPVRFPRPLRPRTQPGFPRGRVNAGTTPSTILDYDVYGNPVYSVPPPGQAITGYDAAGNPLYGGANAQAGVIPGGFSAPAAAAPPSVSVDASQSPAAPAGSGYQSILDWLSQDTLLGFLPNWGVLAGGGLVYVLLTNKRGR